jgi:hypothetical protein
MTDYVPRRRWFSVALLLLVFTSSPATALPLDYTIFDVDTLLDLGTFTVDPALASPNGLSSVEVSAFAITETLGSYGTLTATLAERLNAAGPFARFVDGQITSFASNTQYVLPGDIAVNVDIVPAPQGDAVAILQMWAATYPNLTNMHVASSRGIGIKPVPEPSTMFLMGIGGAGAALMRRRRQRDATKA